MPAYTNCFDTGGGGGGRLTTFPVGDAEKVEKYRFRLF